MSCCACGCGFWRGKWWWWFFVVSARQVQPASSSGSCKRLPPLRKATDGQLLPEAASAAQAGSPGVAHLSAGCMAAQPHPHTHTHGMPFGVSARGRLPGRV